MSEDIRADAIYFALFTDVTGTSEDLSQASKTAHNMWIHQNMIERLQDAKYI